MDELQALLGDSYKEGMTVEEIGEFFKGKKFADLSTGNYVDKGKFDSQVNELTNKLNQTKNELNAKLTDEEKNTKASEAQAQKIKELEALLSANTISGNKNTVNGIMTNTKDIIGVKADDKDFDAFVNNITTEDTDKSKSIATYVAELVKKSYEKGKEDATKNDLGTFGKGKSKGESDEVGEIGKRLAESKNNSNKSNYDYFKK